MPPKETIESTYSLPNESLGFEILPRRGEWTFAPRYYPEKFTQMKKKELDRYGGKCGGESVSIKSIKNREFHAEGVILEGRVSIFNALIDYDNVVDLISPLTEKGGMECYIKRGELKNQAGYDPQTNNWLFNYTLDLVSTGRDEYDTGPNEIITSITGESPDQPDGNRFAEETVPMFKGRPRKNWTYDASAINGTLQDTQEFSEAFEGWQKGNVEFSTLIYDYAGFSGESDMSYNF